jgi:hypothetical protein
MTWIVRNAFLALVAFSTLAIILMIAISFEARAVRSGASAGPSGYEVGVR